jgi:hypothetical protein
MKLLQLTQLAIVAMLVGSSGAAKSSVAVGQHLTTAARSLEQPGVSGIDVLTAQEKLKAGDQPLLRFTALEKVKPVALMTDPRLGAFYIYEFGKHDPVLDKIFPIKKASDLVNMVPLRHKAYYDFLKKMDKKFRGFRKIEAPLGAVVEDAFSFMGLLGVKDYAGTFFKDEYNNGVSMVITVDKVEQLRAIQEYFIKNEIIARNMKPWLLIQVLKNPEAVTEADKAFWSSYFELVKSSDDGVEETLRNERDLRYRIAEIGSKGKWLGNTTFEVLELELEKAYDDLKTTDVALLVAGALSGVVWSWIKEKAVTPAVNRATGKYSKLGVALESSLDTAVSVAKYAALGVAAFVAYRLVVNHLDTIEPADADLDDEETADANALKA